MRERYENLFAYFAISFNMIIGVASVYSAAKDITKKPLYVIIIIVAILGICASISLIVDKAYKPLSQRISELTEGYIGIAEKFKSESLRLRECYLSNDDPEKFKIEILRGCYYLVSDLRSVLQSALGKKVRVCIKMFQNDSNEYLFTYCRDSLTVYQSIKREHNQNINVNKNSDFADIINRNKDIFIGSDLKKDYKEGKYHNTSKEFKYSSSVVVPIRALATEIINDDDNDFYDNIGFLCVDSKDKNLFSNEQSKMCVDLIQTTAHFLYVFISQGNEYYNYLKGNNREVEISG